MSSLDNLTTKIIKDSHEKGSGIIKNAEAEAAKIIEGRVSEAEKIKNDLLEQGRREAETQKSLIISAKKIEIRDALLKTKQEQMQKVFDMAVTELKKLSPEKYLAFLEKYLPQLNLQGGEEVLVPEQYAGISLESVNKKLGKKLTLGDRHVSSGFVIVKDGVENNNTYEALLDYYRDELEKTIAEKLF